MGGAAKKTARRAAGGEQRAERATPRVVYTQAPVALGTVVGPETGGSAGGWRVRVGAHELVAACDPTVDPALLVEAARTGARVVLDTAAGAPPVVVGVLVTARSVAIDRAGDVDARVRRFTVRADEQATMQVPGAFVQLKHNEAETYATRVVVRARELARIIGRMVKLN